MREIIALESNSGQMGEMAVKVAFWFPVVGNKVPIPNYNSAWPNASLVEVTALRDGSVIELTRNYPFPLGTTSGNIATRLKEFRDAVVLAMSAQPNPGRFYGATCIDGVWTPAPTA